MEQPLVLLVSLALVSFSRGAQSPPAICEQKICPKYSVIEEHKGFDVRSYNASVWITTKIVGAAVLSANSKLKEFCANKGYDHCDETWPVLISRTANHDMWLSWFVPPDTTLPENTDPNVKLQHKPEATVYVRVFNGIPSLKWGEENARALWKDMHKDCTDLPPYSGAGFDRYYALYHHNEIWIYATDIQC